jgi:predicted RND superfamily exporter protein
LLGQVDGARPHSRTRYEILGTWLGALATSRPKLVVFTALLLFAILAGGPRAAFSTDYRIFFSKEDPGLAAFEKLEKVFMKTDNVLFVVHAKNERSIATREGLAAIQELTDAAWRTPYASRVDSLTNFTVVEAQGDDLSQHALVDRPASSLDDATLEAIHARASGEPLLVGGLLSRDGSTGAVNVTLRLPGHGTAEVTEAASFARALVARVAARYPGLEIRPCGMALMNDALMQASVGDLAVLVPAMIVVMMIAMVLLLRSVAATVAVAIVLVASSALSMAVAGWLGYPLTPPAVAAPMMVLTVAVADGVHVVLAAMNGLRDGLDKRAAIVRAIGANLEAVTYTWLTTVVGFVCLNYSEAPPVRHLANMTSFGVTAAFVFSVTLLPALLALLPMRASRPDAETREGGVSRSIERLARFVLRCRWVVLAGATVVTASAGLLASRLEINDQFVQYFGKSIAFRRDADFTMKHLSGIYRLEYQVASGAPGGITEPAYLERLDAFAGWLRSQPEVDHVYALSDVLKRVNQVTHGGALSEYVVPKSKEDAQESLFVYEMGLPAGLDLRDRIDTEKTTTRVSVTVKDMSTREMTGFKSKSEAWLRANAPAAMSAEATGPVVIFSALSERNARSMVQGDFVSLALISLCMMIVLRSARLGLLSVVPNVVPIVIGYGVWRLAVGELNIVASVAGSISLGVIVDDTIHFLTKFRNVMHVEADPAVAMRKTLVHVAPAMLSTSGILVLGFVVLTLSSFRMVSDLGWLSILVVGIAPLADLVLVPALVLVFAPARPREKGEQSDALEPARQVQHEA